MAEIKATKVRDGLLLSGQLPPELLSSSSLEIIPLRDGSFLVTQKAVQKMSSLLNEKEKVVVKKLLSVRFDRRTPQEIARLLSREEKETLESLMKRKIVHLFKEGKYSREGVYSVSDFAFHQARDDEGHANMPPKRSQTSPPSSPPQSSTLPPPISSPEHLEKFGWMVLETEQEARSFSNSFPDRVRSGDVKGIRAFDRKYYFITRRFVEGWEKKLVSALSKSEKTSEEIADEIGLTAEGCRCLLYHLCDAGDVLEKHRGKFTKA